MADAWTAQDAALQASDLGAWLVESAPRGEDLTLPQRASRCGDPFAHATRNVRDFAVFGLSVIDPWAP
jgi:hypothetical protein